MTEDSATGESTVSLDGGAKVTRRGLVWGLSNDPTLEDNVIDLGSDVGDMEGALNGLIEGPTYYVRAFATNSEGTGYSPLTTSFKICNEFTVIHTAGLNGAPVDKTVTYGVISSDISGAPRCWLTQNLGADRAAASRTDASEEAAGWYWQYSRPQGYKHTGTVRTPTAGWVSGNTGITTGSWTLANDPCNLLLGGGWRLPTSTEWGNANSVPANWTTPAFTPVLNLHAAGIISNNGAFSGRGTNGYYWSSTNQSSYNSHYLSLTASSSGMSSTYKSHGLSVRCLRDTIVP
jgi:hypothetical protein